MEEEILKVMELGNVSREEAIFHLEKCGSVMEALSLILVGSRHIPKKRRLNESQEFFTGIRKTMEQLEDGIQKGFTSEKSVPLEQGEMQIPLEEKVQQNNCDQGYQILSQQLEVQIPETVCPSPSGYFYDLQLSDQKLT